MSASESAVVIAGAEHKKGACDGGPVLARRASGPRRPRHRPLAGEIKGAKLRYHEVNVAKVDVPFEFTDLVLP